MGRLAIGEEPHRLWPIHDKPSGEQALIGSEVYQPSFRFNGYSLSDHFPSCRSPRSPQPLPGAGEGTQADAVRRVLPAEGAMRGGKGRVEAAATRNYATATTHMAPASPASR